MMIKEFIGRYMPANPAFGVIQVDAGSKPKLSDPVMSDTGRQIMKLIFETENITHMVDESVRIYYWMATERAINQVLTQ